MRLNLKRFKHHTKTLIALVLAIAVPTASAIPTYHINTTQYTNTTVTAKNKLHLSSGNDTTLHGAVAKANSIQADVGGNLHIESPQNTDHYHAASKSTGGSVSIGISNAPFGASINASDTRINSHYKSTQNTSGLQAGDGGFNVNVKGNTKLIGGVISSTQAAIDNKRNQFKTGSLTLQNLKNQAAYEAKGSSITTGVGSMLGASAGIAQDSKKASSTTQSGISGIAGNATVRTGDKDSGIAPIFNKQQVQDEIQAQIAITAAFGKQASKAWGKYASGRQKKAQADLKQAQASQDPEAIAKAKKAANCWSSTGVCRAAGHAAIGGLTTGSTQGAVGGGLASITAPRINQALAKANVKGPAAQALTTILTAAVGSAAGTAGAVAATNEVGNNYLYAWEDKIRRELQAKLARKEKEKCNTRQCQEEIASLKRQIKRYDDLDKKRDLDMIVACHTQGQKEACRDKVASAKAAILSFGGNQAGSREPGTIYAALRAVHGSRNYTPKVKSDPKQLAIMKLAGEIFIDLSPLGTPKDFYLAETPTDYLLAVLGAVPIGDLAKGGKYYRKWNEINKTLGGTLKSADEIAAAAAEGGHKHAGDIAGGIRRGGSAKNGGANAGATNRTVTQADVADHFQQNRKFWTQDPIQYNGNKVYQRNDLIDPTKVDPKTGKTNLELMQAGRAPLGPDGNPVNLHHLTQKQDGAIAEVTQTLHKDSHATLHMPNTVPSGIDRTQFKKWRRDYWKNRANDF